MVLYYRREKKKQWKKMEKMAKTEQEFSKLAKELLHRELSLALEIPCDEVQEYIIKKMNEE